MCVYVCACVFVRACAGGCVYVAVWAYGRRCVFWSHAFKLHEFKTSNFLTGFCVYLMFWFELYLSYMF